MANRGLQQFHHEVKQGAEGNPCLCAVSPWLSLPPAPARVHSIKEQPTQPEKLTQMMLA